MSRRATTTLVVTALATTVFALTASVAGAATRTTTATPRVVPIVMGDPGCHWFSVAGKNRAALSVKGATAFRNLDEAALIFTGAHFKQRLAVGKTLTITKPGVYHITMVNQAPDDNHLKLVVS